MLATRGLGRARLPSSCCVHQLQVSAVANVDNDGDDDAGDSLEILQRERLK